jgi:DNA-binding response OmpR family regulator
MMAHLLRRSGCEVWAAPSAGEALVLLERRLPTHVLLDLMLPDVPGTLVLNSIRRRALPVRVAIVSAAGADSAVMVEALDLRPDAVFHKPVGIAEIEAWLRTA